MQTKHKNLSGEFQISIKALKHKEKNLGLNSQNQCNDLN